MMRQLQWFDTEESNLNEICNYLNQQYGMDICNNVDMSMMEKKMYMSQSLFKDAWNETKDDLEQMVFNHILYPDNYKYDIQIGIYMQLSYLSKSHIKIDILDTSLFDEFMDGDYEIKWREEARRNFPVRIEGEKGMLWCRQYQNLLFNHDNIDIFDYEKEGMDITRYGFQKTKFISDMFKDTDIESRILLDMSLGISLTRVIYKQLSSVNHIRDLEMLYGIISELGRIECLWLRNKIADSIFEVIRMHNFSKDKIRKCTIALKKLRPVINEYYKDILYLCWWNIADYNENFVDDYINEEYEAIEFIWNSYYTDEDLYEEWLYEHGIYKFKYNNHPATTTTEILRNINNYMECIKDSELMSVDKGEMHRIREKMKIDVKEIQKMNGTMEDDIALYEFNLIKQEDGYLIGKSIKRGDLPKDMIKTPRNKVNKTCLYALIHRKVVGSCLSNFRH